MITPTPTCWDNSSSDKLIRNYLSEGVNEQQGQGI